MSYWECHYHVIWATERRYPALTIEREQAAGELILSICRELGVPMLGIGMVEDHVHLAVSIPPRHAVSEVVRRIKGATSTLLRKNEGSTSWPGWQTEYGVVTFSGRSMDSVVHYVREQKTHHASGTVIPYYERIDKRD